MEKRLPQNHTCAESDCDQPTPADMVAIALGDSRYCSPACVRAALRNESHTDWPSPIAFFDPQYRADRDGFLGAVESDAAVISVPVQSPIEALEFINRIEEAYPTAFRVEPERRVNLKVSEPTKEQLDSVKQGDETWDECMRRLAQLHRATRVD